MGAEQITVVHVWFSSVYLQRCNICFVNLFAKFSYFVFTHSAREYFDNLDRANPDFKNLSDKDQVSFMLYGSKTITLENFNQNIIKITIKYLQKTGRFENSLH